MLPEVDFLGVEVHEPGIGHLLVILEQAGITNVRIIGRDVVDGEPVTTLPRDLYIPPYALQVFLEAFEGPLDLLLYSYNFV